MLAALGLAIPLHFPGLYQLVTHLPLFDQVQNQRLHFVWALGMGYDRPDARVLQRARRAAGSQCPGCARGVGGGRGRGLLFAKLGSIRGGMRWWRVRR